MDSLYYRVYENTYKILILKNKQIKISQKLINNQNF